MLRFKIAYPLVFLATIFVSSLANGAFVSERELIVGPGDESPFKNIFYSYCKAKEKTPCPIVETFGYGNNFGWVEMTGNSGNTRIYNVKYKHLPGNLGVIIQYMNDPVQYEINPKLNRDLSYKLVQVINNQLTILDIDCEKLNHCRLDNYETLYSVFLDIAALKSTSINRIAQRYILSPTTQKNAIAAAPYLFGDTPEGKAWYKKQEKELARIRARIAAGEKKLAAAKKREEESRKSNESYASSPAYFKMRDEQQKEQERMQKKYDDIIRYSDYMLK